MKTKSHLKEAWARLSSADSFVLACHVRADGDALGSALALARVLKGQGKDVTVVSESGVSEIYSFIPESDTVVTSTERRGFDMGVLVDSETIGRVGTAAEAVLSARTTACIDHHIPNGGFGEIRVVDPSASATAEVVLELLEANDVAIDTTAAQQLLTGIVADTGAFRFANTTPETFRHAARLTELGAHPSVIARQVYETRPLRAMKLLGRALTSAQIDGTGTVVWATISRRDFEELGATDDDSESIVNSVRMAKGTRVAVLLRETDPDVVHVSLRSRDGIDVNRVAAVFGGGGHPAAAGCTIRQPLDEARMNVVAEVLKWMES